MPSVHHFMLADLAGSLLAVLLYPLFVVIPGYSLAWLLDLCQFRRRAPAFRAALSLCVSLAVCPIATYLAARCAPALLVWALYGAAWLYFAVTVARRWPERPLGVSRGVAAVVLVWMALALFSLVDLQFGRKDYYPVTAMDFSVRTAFTHTMSASGIPPRNPFYFPGHAEPLRYHYFWMIFGALVERCGHGAVSPRHAWIGGAAWSGIALMALVALSLRILLYRGPESFRRRVWIGILLLGVTGLDIVPAAFGWVLQSLGMQRGVLASIDWWNEQVDGFLSTALWEAHYLAGLVICVTAFLLLWEGMRQTAWRARIVHAAVAGLALASAVGVAIYVAFVFGVFLAVWTLLAAARKRWAEIAAYALAGAVALAVAAPYLLALRGASAAGGGTAGPPLQFQVRPFSPAGAILRSVGIVQGWKLSLVNLALLPLNYFLELGFFFVAARWWWQRRQRPLSPGELATAALLASSLLVCSFVRSSVIDNNDLGWRGILLAQFVALLWAVDALSGARGEMAAAVRRGLAVLLLLGAAGSLYDVAILRLYPWLADRGLVSTLGWLSRDRHLGERNYAAREAYEWLDRHAPADARLQFDPHVSIQDTPAFLYANRQIVAGDRGCLAAFGGDPALCPPMLAAIDILYPPPGQAAPSAMADACRQLPVDILVAKDADPVWRDPQSWVWRETPLFANRFYRVFACAPAPAR